MEHIPPPPSSEGKFLLSLRLARTNRHDYRQVAQTNNKANWYLSAVVDSLQDGGEVGPVVRTVLPTLSHDAVAAARGDDRGHSRSYTGTPQQPLYEWASHKPYAPDHLKRQGIMGDYGSPCSHREAISVASTSSYGGHLARSYTRGYHLHWLTLMQRPTTHWVCTNKYSHRSWAGLRGVHPPPTGNKFQHFLVGFTGIRHITQGQDFPQQYSKRPAGEDRDYENRWRSRAASTSLWKKMLENQS